jgi:mannitol/fructose-specific phosphotransferase system IIA component (Ntr-type)
LQKSSFITITDVAACLGVSVREAEKMLGSSGLRSIRRTGEVCYERNELLTWLGRRLGSLTPDRLRDADLTGGSRTGLDPSTTFIRNLLLEGGIHAWVQANTSASLVRKLAGLACESGRVFDAGLLTELLSEREKISSTALPVGVAFPHPVDSRRIYLEDNLLILVRTNHPIPFGEPSGKLTSLFFLMLFNEPSIHLHVLARLNRIIRTRGVVDRLVQVETPDEMLDLISDAEEGLLSA